MKRYRTFTVIGLMAALLLSSCSQEELGEQGMALPEGEYPLQIGSVTLTAEVSEQPWTRVVESTDGMSSVWEGDEQIGVQIGSGQPGIYTVQADGSVVAENPVYWTSTAPTYVTAWYPTNETVDLSNQSNGLAYVLEATQDPVTYEQSVTLNFTHKLAKVRVVLNGTQAGQVESVKIYGITACNHLRGSLDYEASNTGWIKMKKQTFADGTEYWEANVVDEQIDRVKVNGIETTLTKPLTPKVAALNTINLTVGEKITDINKDNTTINDDGYYRVSGTFNQQINITGGKPTIYLESANINVSDGPAINITGGTPTIHVVGEGNSVSSGNNTGIAVSNGATAGNVSITNVIIHATGSGESYPYFGGAGIGSSYNSPCGDITITNAVVNANGGDYSPGIGMGYGNRSQPSIGKITITNSDVTVRAGDFASAIGFPYTESADGPNPAEGYRAGQIIITTDDMDDFLSKLTAGGTVHSMYAEYAQRIGKGSYNKSSAPSVLNQNGIGPWEGVVINGTSYQDGVQ